MGRRVKIGITFSYNEGWIGGTYYFLNLIHALNTLEDSQKPHLTIFCSKSKDFNTVKSIGYPHVSYEIVKKYTPNLLERIINKVSRTIRGKNLILEKPFHQELDLLFRGNERFFFRKVKHHLYWIPDFQEDHLPSFFDKKEIINRIKNQQYLAQSNKNIVFSSKDAFNDFNRLYPKSNAKKFVLNFAVTHPEYLNLDINTLKEKYHIDIPYYFSPNQFWKHKNHITVLKALKVIKDLNQLNFMVAFSGKQEDYRNPDYFQSLKEFVSAIDLQDNVRFLGFIDRKDQLQLMNNAIAIIQPSLFEGWSTVVEDAKAMNQNIIVSDLKIHHEQLEDNASYFESKNEKELSSLLIHYSLNKKESPEFNYAKKINTFGKEFINIVKKLSNE